MLRKVILFNFIRRDILPNDFILKRIFSTLCQKIFFTFIKKVWTPYFGLMHFPLDGELDFDLKNDFYWLKE